MNLCSAYKATKHEHESHYGNGHKRCNECEVFIKWDGAKCPCCGRVLRTRPHNTKLKARLRTR